MPDRTNRSRTTLVYAQQQLKIAPPFEVRGIKSTLQHSPAFLADLDSVQSLEGHTGCVNALSWSADGQRLVSGSDDFRLCVFKLGREGSHGTEANDGPIGLGLETVIRTGHSRNIFGAKFAPFTDDRRLISCAGDSQVRVFDLTRAEGELTRSRRGPTVVEWQEYGAESAACMRVFKCHRDRAKRIALEGSPDVFLTCAEDGDVRQHDLRIPHSCNLTRTSCPRPLISYPGLRLHSLSVSRARPDVIVIAGTSPYAYMHDRRMHRQQMKARWGSEMTEDAATQCVRRFGLPAYGSPNEPRATDLQITACKLSDTNGRDLLVTYSHEDVYLFDIEAEPGNVPSPSIKRSRSEGDERAASRPKAVPRLFSHTHSKPDADPPEARPEAEQSEPMETDDDEPDPVPLPAQPESTPSFGFEEATEDEQQPTAEDQLDARVKAVRARKDAIDGHVPVVLPIRSYSGHRNVDTVKDVNFGFADEQVLSGSDDGRLFAWDKRTAQLLGIWDADGTVVNVMVPHPYLPIIAVSGIDETVKLLAPTYSAQKRSARLAQAHEISERNRAAEENGESSIGGIDASMLFAFLRQQMEEEGGTIRIGGEGEGERCVIT